MDVKAIDIHIHPKTEEFIRASGKRAAQMAAYFQRENKVVSFEELAEQYRGRSMMACLMNTRDIRGAGETDVPNESIAEAVRNHPDVFIGFGCIDPHEVEASLEEIDKIADLGLRGIGELNPGRQKFYPNDETFYPLWERASKRGLIHAIPTTGARKGSTSRNARGGKGGG